MSDAMWWLLSLVGVGVVGLIFAAIFVRVHLVNNAKWAEYHERSRAETARENEKELGEYEEELSRAQRRK